MIVLQGKAYKSVKEAAKEHNLNASALSNRIYRHGTDWPYLFEPINASRPITILGIRYKSISDAAKKHDLKPNVLNSRLQRYGNNWPYLFKPANELKSITILGIRYKSISDAAKKHDLRPVTLNKRLQKYGSNWPYLFDKATDTNIFMQKEHAKLHKQGLISLREFLKDVSLTNTDYDNLQGSIKQLINGQSKIIKIGLTKSDIVLPQDSIYKYAIKKSALSRIKRNADLIQNLDLKIVPQSNYRYYYDAKNHALYGHTKNQTIYQLKRITYKKCAWRISLSVSHYHGSTIAESTIIDLIRNPKIRANDLITYKRIRATYPKINFSTWPRPHYRWNEDGIAIQGFTQQEINKLLTQGGALK